MSDPFPPPDPQYPHDPYGGTPQPVAAQSNTPRWLVPLVAGLVALAVVVGVGVVLARVGEEEGAGSVSQGGPLVSTSPSLPSDGSLPATPPEPTSPSEPADPSGSDAPVTAGCEPVARHQVPAESVHEDGPIDYDASPPHSGIHNPVPLERSPQVVHRDEAPSLVAERAVHNLEHAYVVVWYDESVTDEQLAELSAEIEAAALPKLLAVPWREPMAEPFVLAAWGATQACVQPTADVITTFADAETGRAPEQGAL